MILHMPPSFSVPNGANRIFRYAICGSQLTQDTVVMRRPISSDLNLRVCQFSGPFEFSARHPISTTAYSVESGPMYAPLLSQSDQAALSWGRAFRLNKKNVGLGQFCGMVATATWAVYSAFGVLLRSYPFKVVHAVVKRIAINMIPPKARGDGRAKKGVGHQPVNKKLNELIPIRSFVSRLEDSPCKPDFSGVTHIQGNGAPLAHAKKYNMPRPVREVGVT